MMDENIYLNVYIIYVGSNISKVVLIDNLQPIIIIINQFDCIVLLYRTYYYS